MSNYINEAFKALEGLNEDTFSTDSDSLKAFDTFLKDNSVEPDEITVYDMEAEVPEDIKGSYEGKVILDCNVCRSKLYKDKADIKIDEETNLANIEMECPYCYSHEGFKIIGEVAPFAECLDPNKSVKESLKNRKRKMNKKNRLKEDYEDDLKDAMKLPIVRERVAGDVYDELNGYTYTGPHKEEIDDIIDLLLDNEKLPDYVVMDNNVDEIKWDSATNTLRLPAERVGKAEIDNLFKFRASRYVEQNPDMYPDEDDDFDESLHEAVDLSKKENTIAGVLSKHMDELSKYTDANSMRHAIIDIIDKSDIADKPAVAKLKRDLFSKKSTAALLSTIGTYMTGTKVIKSKRKVKEDLGSDIDESIDPMIIKANEFLESVKKRYDIDLMWSKQTNNGKGYLLRFSLPKDVNPDVFAELRAEAKAIDNSIRVGIKKPEDAPAYYRENTGGWMDFTFPLNSYGIIESINENIGTDIDEYQKWVDYDMKRYGRVSGKTNRLIKKAGLQLVKDKYGDYEVIAGKYDKSLNEDVTITTDDSKTTMTSEDDGKVTVTTEPAECSTSDKAEVIKPVKETTKLEIESNDEDEDVDIEEFDEESFDDIEESFLKEHYSNVKSYATSKVTFNKDSILVEGVITFDNNIKKKTSMKLVSESRDKNKKYKMICENLNTKQSFNLIGDVKGNKFITQSLKTR